MSNLLDSVALSLALFSPMPGHNILDATVVYFTDQHTHIFVLFVVIEAPSLSLFSLPFVYASV